MFFVLIKGRLPKKWLGKADSQHQERQGGGKQGWMWAMPKGKGCLGVTEGV